MIAVSRSPERLAASSAWPLSKPALVDLQVFGEIGLIAARRRSGGLPAPVALRPVIAPRQAAGGMLVAELSRTASGTLAFRGPMTPRFCYPPGAERGDPPFLKLDEAFFIDTSFSCRAERDSGAVTVTAPPRGMVGVGVYRVPLAVFQRVIAEIDAHATLTALPDILTGQRLAGSSTDGEALRQVLARRGVNPRSAPFATEAMLPPNDGAASDWLISKPEKTKADAAVERRLSKRACIKPLLSDGPNDVGHRPTTTSLELAGLRRCLHDHLVILRQ
jgi:hypothetical protein